MRLQHKLRNLLIEDATLMGGAIDKKTTDDNHVLLQKITSNKEFQQIIKQNKNVILDAFAQFCIPCEQMLPVLTQSAQTFSDDVKIIKINLSDQGDDLDIATIVETVDGEEITSAPTFLFIKDGKEVGRAVGLTAQDDFDKLVNKHFGL